jgi:hypothetical protein
MRDLLLPVDSTNLYPSQRTNQEPNVKFKKPDRWLATPGLNRRGRKKRDRPRWHPTLDNRRPRNTSATRCYYRTCADIRRKTRKLG